MSEPRAVATGSFAIFHLAISNPRHLSKRNRLSKYSNEKCQVTNDRLSGSDTLRFPKSDSFVCKLKAGEDQGSLSVTANSLLSDILSDAGEPSGTLPTTSSSKPSRAVTLGG